MNLINLLGLTAATLTTISFLPQVIKVIKTKHTKDLSLIMYLILIIGVILWLGYGILIKDSAIIFGNSIGLFLTLIVLGYKIKCG